MDSFGFNSPSDSFDSAPSNQQGSFDSQPLQDFNFGENNQGAPSFDFGSNSFSTDPSDFISQSGGSPASFDFNAGSNFSTDPSDFIGQSVQGENTSPLPDTIFPTSNEGFNEQNFSLNPSDFIASGNDNINIENSQQLYPPSLETPLDFVPEEKPINDSFFAESSPKVELSSPMGSFGKVEESPKSSPYQSLSSEFSSGAVFQEKNAVLREYELEHEKFLNEKSELERKKKEEVLKQAETELNKFYKEREARVSKQREENSQKAQLVIAAPEDDKHAWLNLEELIDWKCSKDVKEDTTRLRSILITMKHA